MNISDVFRRWNGYRGQRGYLRRGGGRWWGFRRNRWGQGQGGVRRRGGMRFRGRGKGPQRRQPPPSKEELDGGDQERVGQRLDFDKKKFVHWFL